MSSNYSRPIFITGCDDDDYADENSGKWDDDQGLQMRGEKAPLSPVSEAPDEDDDEGLYMYDIRDAGVPAVPDGGYGWVIVFASFICNLIVDGIAYTFGVFMPKLVEDFNEGKSNVAWAGSLLCGVYLCVGPIVSALANKYGCRAVCVAGSIVGAAGFALSALSPSLSVLMLTYGLIGGVGFGLIYLPAVVCVGYYFESKRALATGIAVCGSGVGTFLFAPFATWLLGVTDWRTANFIFAGLILSCGLFGLLMKPLEVQVELEDEDEEDVESRGGGKSKPLLQRMAEDKRHYLERGSLAGSAYFMVQLPDGTMERRLKMPLNVDPGVHSSFNLDQLVPGPGSATPLTPVPTMPLLPTITEAKIPEAGSTAGSEESREGSVDLEKKPKEEMNANTGDDSPVANIPEPILESEEKESEAGTPSESKDLPISTSIPIPKKNSRERRNSDVVHSGSPSSNHTTPVNSFKQEGGMSLLSKSPANRPTMPPRVGSTVGSQSHFGNKSAASIPRNGSAPQFNYGRSIPKNTSVPFFDKQQATRRPSFRAVPIGTATNKGSKSNLQQESRRGSITNTIKGSIASFMGSKIINPATQDEDYNSLWSKAELSDGLIFSSSQKSAPTTEPRHIIRPMSRKDIFYSGSIVNLPEYKSQMSINSYRQSVLNIPRTASGVELDGYKSPDKDKPSESACPCLGSGAGAFKSALAQLMDFSLLANPVFLFIAISNVFGMLGFYVPFVYLIESAVIQGVDPNSAAFLLSIIGVTNTLGRILSGMISDLPQVNSLFMNNVCILLSGLCVLAVPFCGSSYYAYVAVAVFFGLFVSAYISLTSIILVDLLGLENLTTSFGLLLFARGAAGIVGAPLAGAVYDQFQSFDISFYLAGGFFIVSSAISFMIPLVTRCAPEKPILQPPVQPGGFLEDIPEAAESNTNSADLETSGFDQVESCL